MPTVNPFMVEAQNRSISDTQRPTHPFVELVTNDGPPFIWNFSINPPGLRGLNRLAIELNSAEAVGSIGGWSLGRWRNKERTLFSIFFFSARDLYAARSSIGVL